MSEYYQLYLDIKDRYMICVKHSASQTRMIEAQDATIAALKAEVERLKTTNGEIAFEFSRQYDGLQDDYNALTKERDALREKVKAEL